MTDAVVGDAGCVEAEARTKDEAKPTEIRERMYRVINAIVGMVGGTVAGVKDF
jgi:hypothetical protein